MTPITVLCTSVGNDGFQAVHRALRAASTAIRVVGVDCSGDAYGLHLADAAEIVPPRAAGDALVRRLLEIGEREGLEVLLPLSTLDVAFFAARREDFEARGVAVAVSPLDAIETANDKLRLFEAVERLGLPLPAFRHITSRHGLDEALGWLEAERHPVVLRRSFTTGAQGVKIVLPAIPPAERLFARENIVISLDDLRRWLDGLEPFPVLQVCEYLPDARYSVDVFLDGGRARCAVVRTETTRIYDMATRGTIIEDRGVKDLGIAVAEGLGLDFTVNVQIGRDRDGRPRLIEVNPRFPATIDHTVQAGCNMPLWTVLAALGRPCTVVEPRVGVRYRRYWTSLVTGP
jgi:carbamoyl-phosphate synthase large subunit